MVEAAKRCASSPNNESSQDQLKKAADHIRATTSEAYDLRGRGDLLTRWPPRLTGLSIEGCPYQSWDSMPNRAFLDEVRKPGEKKRYEAVRACALSPMLTKEGRG